MQVLEPGHHYILDHLDGGAKSELRFVSRGPLHEPQEGVWNQEVLRVLIDRVQFLDNEVPWGGNDEILYHLRMALALHEARALLRKVEKGELLPETLPLADDGHFILATEPEEIEVCGVPQEDPEESVGARVVSSLGQALRHAQGRPDPGTRETMFQVEGGSCPIESEETDSTWEQGYLAGLRDVLLRVMTYANSPEVVGIESGIRDLMSGSGDRVPLDQQSAVVHPDTHRINFLERIAPRSATGLSLERLRGDVGSHRWRLMRRHYIGDNRASLREALDAAARDESTFIPGEPPHVKS